jgi:hypothetical protein
MSIPEPTDVGPAVGGDRSVAESDRQQVVALLSAARHEGRLTAPEAERRTLAAGHAQVFDDLVVLTRDLVATDTSRVSYSSPATEDTDRVVCIFSGVTRQGDWRVRRHTSVLVAFGGVELDMSEATFEGHEVVVEVFCLFGGVELTVPEGTTVNNQVLAIFGGCDQKITPPDPTAPKLTVKGFVGFGGVETRNPKKSRRRRNRSWS